MGNGKWKVENGKWGLRLRRRAIRHSAVATIPSPRLSASVF